MREAAPLYINLACPTASSPTMALSSQWRNSSTSEMKAVVAHSRWNDQVKRANSLILQGLKQCILNGWRSLQWVTEMPSIACLEIAHNTQSIDRLHPVFYGLRYRCHPSNRSWLRSSHVKTYNEKKSKEARQDALPAWRSSGASGSLVCALLLWSTSCTCVCLAN